MIYKAIEITNELTYEIGAMKQALKMCYEYRDKKRFPGSLKNRVKEILKADIKQTS